MWVCAKCQRAFKNKNQSHYCGKTPETIDEYILAQDDAKQQDLFHLRVVIASALPEAEERISWSMPTFWQNQNILNFAASKNHIGFYPGPQAVEQFAGELSAYKTDKGTIRIPYGKINDDLIRRIAIWCLEMSNRA